MCTFGVLGLSCANPGGPKPPGLHTTAREPKRAHFRAPALQKHHQNSTRRHPERHKKSETVAGKGEKRAKFWAVWRRAVRRRRVRRSPNPQPQQQHNSNNTTATTQQQQHNSNNTTATTQQQQHNSNNTTTQQHNNTTTQQHNNTTTQQHNNTTQTQQHNTQQPPSTTKFGQNTKTLNLAKVGQHEFWPFLGPSLLQDVRVLPHPKFWPFFWAALSKMSLNFQIFGPVSSPHTVSIVSCVL